MERPYDYFFLCRMHKTTNSSNDIAGNARPMLIAKLPMKISWKQPRMALAITPFVFTMWILLCLILIALNGIGIQRWSLYMLNREL